MHSFILDVRELSHEEKSNVRSALSGVCFLGNYPYLVICRRERGIGVDGIYQLPSRPVLEVITIEELLERTGHGI